MPEFDGAPIKINCPNCDQIFEVRLGRSKADGHTTCPACQQIIALAKGPLHAPLHLLDKPSQWFAAHIKPKMRH